MIYQAAIYTPIIVFASVSAELPIPWVPSFLLTHTMDLITTALILYLSLGACVQYAHIRLKVVDLFDKAEECNVLLCMRAIICVCSCLVTGLRVLAGAYSVALPILVKDENMDINIQFTALVMVPLALSSVAVNLVLRFLIWRAKKENREVLGQPPNGEQQPFPACKYMALATVIVVMMVANLTLNNGDVVKMGAQLGFMSIAVPSAVILNNEKFYYSARARILERLPDDWSLPVFKVSPE